MALPASFEADRSFFVKDTPAPPKHCSDKIRRHTDIFYKIEHEAHVRVGDHPRIVRYYGWDERGLLFEKHTGGDMLTRLLVQRDPTPALSTRLQWACDVAEGMAFLHSKGVIWVDVSMTNVLLPEGSDRAVLCDLGGAYILPMPQYKPLPKELQTTVVTVHPMMGLPNYPHKHVWDGEGHAPVAEISPHFDRFGYGIMLFSLLSLRFPHSRFLVIHDFEESMRIADLHFSYHFDTLGDVPEYAAFEAIIQKCFRAEYKSSDDLMADVKAASAAMPKDAPLLQARVEDPIREYAPSTGRHLFPFDREDFDGEAYSDDDDDTDSN
ncbi:kinase-like domain-containing protein [Mycena metata]|uniref:Kinase-like domain-containing protein n=1 Tax=Mycena metata TaxID=1033252 RepID=A0AAD7HSZ9_9AGAR|nr:kinase-like domain-containing protein [Mycena metata]